VIRGYLQIFIDDFFKEIDVRQQKDIYKYLQIFMDETYIHDIYIYSLIFMDGKKNSASFKDIKNNNT
jgi:hypothetical protein